ncbi:hypothetical protein QTP88_022346 [Uroleucon formosanum]
MAVLTGEMLFCVGFDRKQFKTTLTRCRFLALNHQTEYNKRAPRGGRQSAGTGDWVDTTALSDQRFGAIDREFHGENYIVKYKTPYRLTRRWCISAPQAKGSGDVMEIENNRLNNRHLASRRVCYDTGSAIVMLRIILTSNIQIRNGNSRTRVNIVALHRRRTKSAQTIREGSSSSPRPHATVRFLATSWTENVRFSACGGAPVQQAKQSGDVMEIENNCLSDRHSANKRFCYDIGQSHYTNAI